MTLPDLIEPVILSGIVSQPLQLQVLPKLLYVPDNLLFDAPPSFCVSFKGWVVGIYLTT